MDYTPFEQAGSLRVGSVDYVAPDEIKGTLDIESPESVALNTGHPRPFPRVNSYLMIQVDDAFLVGQAEWLTIERSPFPKRRGMQDFGIVDLPYPLRRIKLNPLGMLRKTYEGEHEDECEDQCDKEKCKSKYDFQRGSDALPSVGAAVFLPTERQLRAIIESGKNRRVKIGISPLAGDAEVRVDPNRLFGRHLAVLGNTGSGKSCSVAGLIRWSLEAIAEANTKDKANKKQPNARFIILDPNGEYSRAFKNDREIKARIFNVAPGENECQLKVPLWFWNSEEWCAFTQASSGTQRPILRRALRDVKSVQEDNDDVTEETNKRKQRLYLRGRRFIVQRSIQSGEIQEHATRFASLLESIKEDIKQFQQEFSNDDLKSILIVIEDVLKKNFKTFIEKSSNEVVEYYTSFSSLQITPIVDQMQKAFENLGGAKLNEESDEDIPLPFDYVDLIEHLWNLAEQEGVPQHIEPLVSRIQTLLSNPRMKEVICNDNDIKLEKWLNDYIGSNHAENGCISIIDLSLVPTEITHIITAVVARMVFESLQRYMKLNNKTLPTVLVMEEAHTFVKRRREDIDNQDVASVCCQIFERIAREGRKFGLGLVLSSQRPSELSPTVLSQCNTFLLHRISNNRDQELVQKLVPDNLKGLLRELPLLPSQRAVLLGWASELPVLVKMRNLPIEQQPQSNDPEIWETWLGQDDNGKSVERMVNWREITDKWQNGSSENQTSQDNNLNDQQKGEGQK